VHALTIRRALPADAGRLAEFAARTFGDTYSAANSADNIAAHLSASFNVARQRAEIQSPGIITLLAERDGRILGYVQMRRGKAPDCVPSAAAIELWRFYVDRPAIGRGVASRLMAASCSEALSASADTLWLGVWERNPRAIAFYRKCGFRTVGKQVFMLGEDAQTDLVMVRPLADVR
jgi:ribosomal protein S18 acetylase RimI-like enzyme